MAKLKAPLMSLGASGQLAKTLVFFPWKGLNVVREYVIPAYSRTTPQASQRDYVKAAVAKIHTAMADPNYELREADQTAYAALASARGKIMTWFNMAVKLWCDVKVAVKSPIIYGWGYTTNTAHDSIDLGIFIYEETNLDLTIGKFYFGTSKTNLIHSVDADIAVGTNASLTNEDLTAFLSAGIKYYWQFRPTADPKCVGADSGIYSFKAT